MQEQENVNVEETIEQELKPVETIDFKKWGKRAAIVVGVGIVGYVCWKATRDTPENFIEVIEEIVE